MLNHKHPKETTWYYNNQLKGFVIEATQNLQRGVQIFDSYGCKCNSRYLLNYGFTLPNNQDYNEIGLNVTISPTVTFYKE